jgi:glycerophosphoryl diester phosphodiesterase
MGSSNENPRRTEPIFALQTPILFAHRGGAREVAESTALAFRYALETARADVLELDVQLTLDGQFVVWHGPELSNVKITGEDDNPDLRARNKIYDFNWSDLDGKAWVADPVDGGLPDLGAVPGEEDRCLLLLSDFLKRFPGVPLNIEMKDSFLRKINDTDRKGLKHHLKAFTEILLNEGGGRTIVVVSASGEIIDAFRKLNGTRFPTGLSIKEQLMLLLLGPLFDMRHRALETSYSELASSRPIIDAVRKRDGSTFVFLTEFGPLLPAIDAQPGTPGANQLYSILDRGVDGIMTDRPKRVRKIMDAWIAAH